MSKSLLEQIDAEIALLEECLKHLRSARAVLISPDTIGATMEDGTIYVGMSPETGQRFYAMPHDLGEPHTWESAQKAVARQTFGGRTDWRMPTIAELELLYRNRTSLPCFTKDLYWSSTKYCPHRAWFLYFGDGFKDYVIDSADARYHVRPVRG